jgi:hypothetical protein
MLSVPLSFSLSSHVVYLYLNPFCLASAKQTTIETIYFPLCLCDYCVFWLFKSFLYQHGLQLPGECQKQFLHLTDPSYNTFVAVKNASLAAGTV